MMKQEGNNITVIGISTVHGAPPSLQLICIATLVAMDITPLLRIFLLRMT